MVVHDLIELSRKLAEQRHVAAVRRGLMLNMPFFIIGSFVSMINNLPIAWYQQFLLNNIGINRNIVGQAMWNGSFEVMSILLVFSTSWFLAESHPSVKKGIIHPLTVSLVSFSCLVVIMQPFCYDQALGMPFYWTGSRGLFFAIVTTLVSTEIFLRLCSCNKINIRVCCNEADPVIGQVMSSLVPAAITLTIFGVAKMIAVSLGISDIHQYVNTLIANLFTATQSTLAIAIVFQVVVHFLWFCGMHGMNVLEPVMHNLYKPAAEANMALALSGGQATEIFTATFFNSFVILGGSGSTICLILALMLVVRRGNRARLARLSILPGIFNINELLIFGLPIVLNPIYLIPFLMVPMILTLISYAAVIVGFLPVTISAIDWTTPPLLSGYLAVGSWKGVALQTFNIALGTMIYFPFVVLAEKQNLLENRLAFGEFIQQVELSAMYLPKQFLHRRDSVGNLARVLAHDLKKALAGHELILEYQPQVNHDRCVIGVEALLRWPHKLYGRVPPPLIITIAEEGGMIEALGKWVFSSACRQAREWKKVGINGIRMSVNVSVTQLYSSAFTKEVAEAMKDNDIAPGEIEIEITENIALHNDSRTRDTLHRLREMGVRIAIDDFGMGHSSLIYIKNFPIDTLKIDRSLSKDVVKDISCQGIISSLTTLCSSLNIENVVEYVETEQQRDKLNQLGCTQYQGYLYSPALPPNEAESYIRGHLLPKTLES